ncbi:DNA topoisomerase 1 [uncultured Spirochaetota bacterium]|jgi:DNA topoisomerase-1|nr:DNA topoisomerase 1 [uncultured Spirochaetota bacterium]
MDKTTRTAKAATTAKSAKAVKKAKATAARKGSKSGKSAKSPGAKNLVIVESPAKAKTIEKYLGSNYKVLASMGHLIDLPKSRIGVDVEHGFEPEYLTIRGRAGVLKDLVAEAKKSESVLLASDPDREGEAIAYLIGKHLEEKIPGLPVKRVAFNEITQAAVKDAVKAPRPLDLSKVDAQKARRVLDRLVGYNLSPLLWKKVKNGLSAGRVQSAALKLICDREKEVESFIPEEFWTIEASLKASRSVVKADLVLYKGKKPQLGDEEKAKRIVSALEGKPASVIDKRSAERLVRPKAPFTTSTLQQTAANRLGFTSKKTMQIAQILYEGINLGSRRSGLITYMRTDSTRIAETALEEARTWLAEHYPAQLPKSAQRYSAGKQSQDAHEAIRPTSIAYTPDSVAAYLQKDELKLYTLVWERFVASQMIPALVKVVTADIGIGDGVFRTSASAYVEEGFYKVIKLSASKEEKASHSLALEVGQDLGVEKIDTSQHFTQGPSRYTDATIIKALEELGIGRPSTYAPTISTLLERYYVSRQSKQLAPTTLGRMISDILTEFFPEVIGAGFTAQMESLLDKVEDEKADWVQAMKEFYFPFKGKLDEVMSTLSSKKGQLDEATDILCERCGKPMVKKLGRFGFFLACSGFPGCKNTKSIPVAVCPKCGGDIVERKNPKGKRKLFYGCNRYPACDFVTYDKPTDKLCPKCGWFLVEKSDRVSGSHKACINPSCDYLHSRDEEKAED